MADQGLRELKKARTRRLIAETAARLFADRGYEQVSVADVARAAEVSEQTVFNYFPTKEHLVIDLDEPLQDDLSWIIQTRPAGVTPAAAIREYTLAFVDGIRHLPEDRIRGELGYLATASPTVHRLSLAMSQRQADTLAPVISQTTDLSRLSSQLAAMAIAGIFQIIVHESGWRSRAGLSPGAIADELVPEISALLDDLDRTGFARARDLVPKPRRRPS